MRINDCQEAYSGSKNFFDTRKIMNVPNYGSDSFDVSKIANRFQANAFSEMCLCPAVSQKEVVSLIDSVTIICQLSGRQIIIFLFEFKK